MKKIAIGLILLCAVLLTATIYSSSQNYKKTIQNFGKIKAWGVEFYFDIGCTNKTTQINWGFLDPGEIKNTTLYCKNIKNQDVTMTLNVTNWNPPSASSYLTTYWNYTGAVLAPDSVTPIKFTLAVDINVTGITEFSYDYVISTEKV